MNKSLVNLVLWCAIFARAIDNYYATSFPPDIGDQTAWSIAILEAFGFNSQSVSIDASDFQTQSDNPNTMSYEVITTIDEDNAEGASVWLKDGVGPSVEIDFGDYRDKFAVCVIYKD